MKRYFFSATLTKEQCFRYYRGEIKNVVVTENNGQRIQLKFKHFHPFIDSVGVRGYFRLTLADDDAFVSLEKIN